MKGCDGPVLRLCSWDSHGNMWSCLWIFLLCSLGCAGVGVTTCPGLPGTEGNSPRHTELGESQADWNNWASQLVSGFRGGKSWPCPMELNHLTNIFWIALNVGGSGGNKKAVFIKPVLMYGCRR